jgi:hypothetical protein
MIAHAAIDAKPGLPIALWVLLLAGVFFVGEYVWLRVRKERHASSAAPAERRLAGFATALRDYARDNLQRLPETLEELDLPESQAVRYRPIPRLNLDEKLILVHDAGPVHKVIEFPVLRDGRGVVFCSGRMHIISEEVFEKLLAADDALRERLGLPAVEAGRYSA